MDKIYDLAFGVKEIESGAKCELVCILSSDLDRMANKLHSVMSDYPNDKYELVLKSIKIHTPNKTYEL